VKDYILYQKLLREVHEGRVNVSRTGDLAIFKYTQDTHIQGLWNDTNRQARGIIFRSDGTVVARPFPKFFNLGEVSETMVENLPWDEEIEIAEKVDGSCGIGYFLTGDVSWSLATPGSMESNQAKMGTQILNANYPTQLLPKDCTPIFEIIYPENRIVVDYKGETFLCLLGVIEHGGTEWHPMRVDQLAEKCGFKRPSRYNLDLRGDIPFEDNHEGYVARFASGRRVKVKSPAYLRVHRLLNYMSPKGVIELIRGKEYGVTLRELPHGIRQDFDDIRAYVQTMHDKLRIETEDIAGRIPDADRKTQALWIQANTPKTLTGIVFGLLDKKKMIDNIWKIVLEKVKDEKGKPVTQE